MEGEKPISASRIGPKKKKIKKKISSTYRGLVKTDVKIIGIGLKKPVSVYH